MMNLSRHDSTDRSSNVGWVARVVRGTIGGNVEELEDGL